MTTTETGTMTETETTKETIAKDRNLDKVFFLIGDNLQHMCLYSEKNALRIASQAWILNLEDVHEKSKTMEVPYGNGSGPDMDPLG